MAIDFPASPAAGQIFNAAPGLSFVYKSGSGWQKAPLTTALPKNYLINPSAVVSQQNGRGGSPAAAAYDWVTADMWVASWNASGNLSAASYAGYGESAPMWMNAAAALPAFTGSMYAHFYQQIEGQRFADFMWGTSLAQQVVFSFVTACDRAGVYSVKIGSRTVTPYRSWIGSFTINAAGAWEQKTIIIPGDTGTGTVYPTDNRAGLIISVGAAWGPNFNGALGWQDGDLYSPPGMGNAWGAGTGYFQIVRPGLYLDPYKTGLPPAWTPPDYASELQRCQRYWYKAFGFQGGVASGTVVSRSGMRHPVPMRASPVATIVGAPRLYDGAVTTTVTSLGVATNAYAAEYDITGGGTFATGGKAAAMYYQSENDYIAMNARW